MIEADSYKYATYLFLSINVHTIREVKNEDYRNCIYLVWGGEKYKFDSETLNSHEIWFLHSQDIKFYYQKVEGDRPTRDYWAKLFEMTKV